MQAWREPGDDPTGGGVAWLRLTKKGKTTARKCCRTWLVVQYIGSLYLSITPKFYTKP